MKSSKTKILVLGLAGALVSVSSMAFGIEKTGNVKMYLMNPEGRVDGLLLSDGTQVHFPPHLSEQLVSLVKKSDEVKIDGTKESDRVVRADSITNVNSKKTLRDTPPAVGDASTMPPPPPAPGPGGPLGPERSMARLTQLSASGTVTEELMGRRGEIVGAVLSDSTIVHFGPRLIDSTSVKLNKGQKLSVTGFGTKNEFGQSIEATEVKQQ